MTTKPPAEVGDGIEIESGGVGRKRLQAVLVAEKVRTATDLWEAPARIEYGRAVRARAETAAAAKRLLAVGEEQMAAPHSGPGLKVDATVSVACAEPATAIVVERVVDSGSAGRTDAHLR